MGKKISNLFICCPDLIEKSKHAIKHKCYAAKKGTVTRELKYKASLVCYLSNLESYLELFGRFNKEPQALLHHGGSWGVRETSCDDEKL